MTNDELAAQMHVWLGSLFTETIGVSIQDAGLSGVYERYVAVAKTRVPSEQFWLDFYDDVIAIVRNAINRALHYGEDNAILQLENLGVSAEKIPLGDTEEIIRQAVDAVMAVFTRQVTSYHAAIALNRPPEEAAGFLRASETQGYLADTATSVAWWAWNEVISRASIAEEDGGMIIFDVGGIMQTLKKQAVAVIDNRTTQTCRNVDGQTVDLHGNFTLIGEPRYADTMPYPPFHRYCRTTVKIVKA